MDGWTDGEMDVGWTDRVYCPKEGFWEGYININIK